MKKRILMLTVALFIASSCSRKNAPTPKNEAPAMQKESTEKIQEEEPEDNNRQPENPLKEIPQKINIDFTKMNYNMAYSIMFEMMVEPEKYKEKTVTGAMKEAFIWRRNPALLFCGKRSLRSH